MKTLNPSIKHHVIFGALISVWSFLVSIMMRPFEHGTMDLEKWMYVSVGFSLAAFISYACVAIYQNIMHQKLSRWNWPLEFSCYVLFFSLYTLLTFNYYLSSIIEGIYGFPQFFAEISLAIIVIMTPVIFLVRRYAIKLIPKEEEFITIKGDYKLDFLKIKKDELISVSNTQNYVEISFVENGQCKTKLIRSSLKNIHSQLGFLIQVHRSHLINPTHFKSWKDSSTILLTYLELPVSKNYKDRLLTL